MKSFSIIEVSDHKWSDIISSAYQYDFYHTKSYSQLVKKHKPLLCVAFRDSDFIAIPIVLREIEGTDFLDSTSVYGYCGPVSNQPFESLSMDHISFFQAELLQFFKDRQIISAFSRLHPFMDQTVVFNDFGIVKEINKTVAIDLRLSEDHQLRGYRKSHRKRIIKLRNEGFIVIDASGKAEIDAFTQIYNDSMVRLNADPSLFFVKEYFYEFLNNPDFKTKLLLAKKGNEITAGGIFTITNKIMQCHLLCVKEEFKNDSPGKLIIDQARLIGNELNMNFLHLGGGVSGSSEDSLFYFKAGFSDKRFIFNSWQLIVNEPKYSFLMDFYNIDNQKVSNHFPAYRINFRN